MRKKELINDFTEKIEELYGKIMEFRDETEWNDHQLINGIGAVLGLMIQIHNKHNPRCTALREIIKTWEEIIKDLKQDIANKNFGG